MVATTADVQANGDMLISLVLCSFGHPFVTPVHLPLICTQEWYMDNLTDKQSGLRQRIGSKKAKFILNNINYLLHLKNHYSTQSMPGQLQSHFIYTSDTAEGFNQT